MVKHTITFIEIWGHQGKTSIVHGNGLRGLREIWGLCCLWLGLGLGLAPPPPIQRSTFKLRFYFFIPKGYSSERSILRKLYKVYCSEWSFLRIFGEMTFRINNVSEKWPLKSWKRPFEQKACRINGHFAVMPWFFGFANHNEVGNTRRKIRINKLPTKDWNLNVWELCTTRLFPFILFLFTSTHE